MITVTLKGQDFHFMNVREFSEWSGIPVNTLNKKRTHPAKIKDGGAVYWSPELWGAHMLSKAPDSDLLGWSEDDLMKAKDFIEDAGLTLIEGGQR